MTTRADTVKQMDRFALLTEISSAQMKLFVAKMESSGRRIHRKIDAEIFFRQTGMKRGDGSL